MIVVCITICVVTLIICITICFIHREKTYTAKLLSIQQLLTDVNIRATSVLDKFLDTFNVPDVQENKKYRDLFDAIEDIVKMTNEYN